MGGWLGGGQFGLNIRRWDLFLILWAGATLYWTELMYNKSSGQMTLSTFGNIHSCIYTLVKTQPGFNITTLFLAGDGGGSFREAGCQQHEALACGATYRAGVSALSVWSRAGGAQFSVPGIGSHLCL